MNSAYFDVDSTDLYFSYVTWAGVQAPGTFIKENRQSGLSRGKMSYLIHMTDAVT